MPKECRKSFFMKLFDKRPLCFACTAALILSFVFAYAGIYTVLAAAVCVLAAAVVFAALKMKSKRTALTVCAAVIIMCAAFSVHYFNANAVSTGKTLRVKGYVLPDGESDYLRIYNITEADGRRVSFKVVSEDIYDAGKKYVEFESDAVISDYSGYNEQYYKSKGAFYSAEFSGLTYTGKTHKTITYYAGIIREYAASRLYAVSDNAGILCRVFLGIRGGAPRDFVSDMKTLGVSHLLALSGLHVTALLAGADIILNKITGKRRVKYVILSCAALFYMAVTGFAGSVVRASLMYLLSRVSLIAGRKNDPVTSLTVSAFIIIAFNPPSVFDVGFLLSFFATLGIITAGAPAARFIEQKLPAKIRFFRYVISPVIITVSAILFTVPVAAYSYGSLAYGAVLYNLVIAPFVTVILYLCPYLLLFSYVPFAGRFLGLAADGLCEILVKTVDLLADHAVPSVSISYPFVIPLIIVFVCAAAVMAVFSKKRVHYLCVALAFVLIFSLLVAIFSLTVTNKTVIIVSAGKYGDYAAVLDYGKCTVFDFTSGGTDGFYPLCRKLLFLGITKADYALAAKPESRHLQSVIQICSYFDIENIYAPSDIADDLANFCGKTVIVTEDGAQKYTEASQKINEVITLNAEK